MQKVYLREAARVSAPKVYYEWDIPIVMISQEKLEFQAPCRLWLTKGIKAKNLTDTANENQFVIVNPEEIGMKITIKRKHYFILPKFKCENEI